MFQNDAFIFLQTLDGSINMYTHLGNIRYNSAVLFYIKIQRKTTQASRNISSSEYSIARMHSLCNIGLHYHSRLLFCKICGLLCTKA